MKTAFLFSGQGDQTAGMMRDICENSPAAGTIFETADAVLGRDISTLCFEGPQEALNLTHNTQPCLLAAELAAFAALAEHGIHPDAAAGFSLGEYAALTAAGVMTTEDAFRIIQIRADAMQDACPVGKGGMAAILKQDAAAVQALCEEAEGYVVPVNYNCPGQIVVSGEAGAVEQVCSLAKSRKIRAVRLPVSVPSHCALMAPAAEKLREAFRGIVFREAGFPCYSDVDAAPYRPGGDTAEQLCRQVQSPVLWEQLLRNMRRDGFDCFVEIGPGTTLSQFVRKCFPEDGDVRILNVRDWESLEKTETELRG